MCTWGQKSFQKNTKYKCHFLHLYFVFFYLVLEISVKLFCIQLLNKIYLRNTFRSFDNKFQKVLQILHQHKLYDCK